MRFYPSKPEDQRFYACAAFIVILMAVVWIFRLPAALELGMAIASLAVGVVMGIDLYRTETAVRAKRRSQAQVERQARNDRAATLGPGSVSVGGDNTGSISTSVRNQERDDTATE